MSAQSVEQDVAYLKELAEAGVKGVPGGGEYHLVWGVVVALGLGLTYGAVNGVLPIDRTTLTFCWSGLIAAGWAVTFFLSRGMGAKPEGLRFANRLVAVTWLAAGIAMTTMWLGLVVGGMHQALMMPIASAIAGVGCAVSATIFRLNWLYGVAVGWWVVAFVSFLMYQRIEFILFSAAAILILQGGTGLALLLLERRHSR